ncbi:integrase [Xanthomonas citri]|nr:integrase [Xanthomonas citri]MCT8356607.1 integrase [Xanthomonas citri pv. anacardii]MCT8368069.1 integrase [Xanthomonas citri pv. anacardii]MCT8374859.1 integrase [Xanthomonas citri pv. anacardii]MCT8376339.1 integrase [Xanthomonas citri pv. anacardii]
MGSEQAYELARQKLAAVRETGEHPSRQAARSEHLLELKGVTLADCFAAYIEDLEKKVRNKKAKPASVRAVQDSLARFARAEVGLADKAILRLTDRDIHQAFENLRRSSMVRSNRIPTAMRTALADYPDWAELSTQQLEALGISGRYLQRVKAAGRASTEHSFTDAKRAVDLVLKRERKAAARDQREPVLRYNPFQVIHDDDLLRDAQELRRHYERAEVRNPLGDDTLPRVLKVILARRDEQGGLNATGADYLLLTLLWGTRRSEAAQLRWFDRCSPGELRQSEVSWVWLAGPDEVNPYTRRAGSQVYLFDTKSGEERYLPVTYFAQKVLERRFDERLGEAEAQKALAGAEAVLKAAKTKGSRAELVERLSKEVEQARRALPRSVFVFPARSHRSKTGHYSDSKSIVANVRRDAGLLDVRAEVDIGLTTHDFRRTLGRYAALLFGESRIVSQLLHHHTPGVGTDRMAAVSERYTEQEWSKLREAMGRVEESMIAMSPRVWNRLKGTDRPRLDEVNDEPVAIFSPRVRKIRLES